MAKPELIPYTGYREYPVEEMQLRAAEFCADIRRRRSVRQFSERPVPREIIEQCLLAAGSAPSGANLQPWHFVSVSDPALKHKIRHESEKAEHQFYRSKAPPEWLQSLVPLGTDEHKPFLDSAPWLIVIFAFRYGMASEGGKIRNYYVRESVGIATGILIAAFHHAGLASLTYTPAPMGFLNRILDRPSNERPFLILAAGYPAEDARVPVIPKKPLGEIATFI